MEREAGIEPAATAWKAATLPLSYPRNSVTSVKSQRYFGRERTDRRKLAEKGTFHHLCRDQVHAVRREVARVLVAAQTRHVRDDFFAEPVKVDFGRARRPEQDDRSLPERQRQVHRQRIAGDRDIAMTEQRREVAHGVIAAWIDQRDRRRPLEPIVALLFRRPAEQQELHVFTPPDTRHEIDVAVLAPLFERPAPAGARVQADDRAFEVEAHRLEMFP